MASPEIPTMLLTVPADARFFRSVRLAIGSLATVIGFDVEAIDDIRIGVDELCGALQEAGDGSDLTISVAADLGRSIRIEGRTVAGTGGFERDRFAFSQQILSVVADAYGVDAGDGAVVCWLERALSDWQAGTGEP